MLQEAPRGHPDCLTGKTFVLSGVLDSLKREEAEDFIKRHGGKVGRVGWAAARVAKRLLPPACAGCCRWHHLPSITLPLHLADSSG